MQYLVVEDITATVPIVSDDCILLNAGLGILLMLQCDVPLSGDCLLPALLHRTFACMSASPWTASSSARQTAHLSASMSTTATKHLPSCVHKAGLSFAKILNWDGQQRRLFSLSQTQSIAKETIKVMSRCPTLFWSGKRRDRQRQDSRLYEIGKVQTNSALA